MLRLRKLQYNLLSVKPGYLSWVASVLRPQHSKWKQSERTHAVRHSCGDPSCLLARHWACGATSAGKDIHIISSAILDAACSHEYLIWWALAGKTSSSHKKQGSKAPPVVTTGDTDLPVEEVDLLTGIDMTLLHRFALLAAPTCTTLHPCIHVDDLACLHTCRRKKLAAMTERALSHRPVVYVQERHAWCI